MWDASTKNFTYTGCSVFHSAFGVGKVLLDEKGSCVYFFSNSSDNYYGTQKDVSIIIDEIPVFAIQIEYEGNVIPLKHIFHNIFTDSKREWVLWEGTLRNDGIFSDLFRIYANGAYVGRRGWTGDEIYTDWLLSNETETYEYTEFRPNKDETELAPITITVTYPEWGWWELVERGGSIKFDFEGIYEGRGKYEGQKRFIGALVWYNIDFGRIKSNGYNDDGFFALAGQGVGYDSAQKKYIIGQSNSEEGWLECDASAIRPKEPIEFEGKSIEGGGTPTAVIFDWDGFYGEATSTKPIWVAEYPTWR